MSMKELGGVFAPTVTAFRPQDGELDLDWVKRHLAFLRARGCDGVVPAGTTGEGTSLGYHERCRLIDAVLEGAQGMPVIAGVGTPSLADTIDLARYAFRAGVDAVLVLPPYYYRSVPTVGLVAYFQRLCDRALQPGQRIFLYHIPPVSGVPITHELLDALLETHRECVGGLKDSSRDPESLRAFVARYPDLRIFCGSDNLADLAYSSGAAGTISVMANLVPDWLQAVRQARGTPAAGPLQERVTRARRAFGAYPTQAAMKYAVQCVAGLPPAATRPPNVELTAGERSALERDLHELGVLPPVS